MRIIARRQARSPRKQSKFKKKKERSTLRTISLAHLNPFKKKNTIIILLVASILIVSSSLFIFLKHNGIYIKPLYKVNYMEDAFGESVYKVFVKPHKLPKVDIDLKFSSPEEAILYVRSLEYNEFINEPNDVYRYQKGNCLGKARLLYSIGKENGWDFAPVYKDNIEHVNIMYNGNEIDLTK